MAATRPLQLAVAGAAALLLVGGLAGAVIVDDEDADLASGTGTTVAGPTTSSLAPDLTGTAPTSVAPAADATPTTATPGSAAPATTATAAPGRATTTTPARPAGAPAAAPGPLTAPKAGAYGYDVTSTPGGGSPSTSRQSVTVEAAGREGATILQDITLPADQMTQGATIRNRVAWGAAGAVVRSSQAGGSCVWQPPWPQYVGDLRVGRAWTYDTRCTVTSPIQATVTRRGSSRVTGAQVVAAAGRQEPTWTIAFDETTVIATGLGTFTVRSVGTEQLAPALGVPLTRNEELSGTTITPGSTAKRTLATLP